MSPAALPVIACENWAPRPASSWQFAAEVIPERSEVVDAAAVLATPSPSSPSGIVAPAPAAVVAAVFLFPRRRSRHEQPYQHDWSDDWATRPSHDELSRFA